MVLDADVPESFPDGELRHASQPVQVAVDAAREIEVIVHTINRRGIWDAVAKGQRTDARLDPVWRRDLGRSLRRRLLSVSHGDRGRNACDRRGPKPVLRRHEGSFLRR